MDIKRSWSTIALTKNQICFLDDASKKSKFSGGKKLSRTEIIRALLRAAGRMRVDASGVKSEEELKTRFLVAFTQYK